MGKMEDFTLHNYQFENISKLPHPQILMYLQITVITVIVWLIEQNDRHTQVITVIRYGWVWN